MISFFAGFFGTAIAFAILALAFPPVMYAYTRWVGWWERKINRNG